MDSKVYALSLSECTERLLEVKSAVVVTHIRPDGDTLGTSAALCKILEALGKSAELLPSDKVPKRLAFLTEGVKIAESTDGKSVITCDVASPSQLGALFEKLPEVYLSIDHHEISSPFCPHYTVGGASSAAEVLLGIVRELISRGLLRLTPDIAYPLYAAMSSDTGGFLFSSTTADTYRAAAELVETGINHADINHRLFYSKSEEQIRAEGFIAASLVSAGNISYAAITLADKERLDLSDEHFETAIDVVRSLIGTEIAFTLKELTPGKFRVSLRSTGFNVAKIAESLSGGGHVRAAGCAVEAESPKDAAELIIETINKYKGSTKQ